jgi:signal transduction histidine kinase
VNHPDSIAHERVLIVAPLGADASNIGYVLHTAALPSTICPNTSAAALEMAQGCGAVLLTEEALRYERRGDLMRALDAQPSWSDVPVLLIVSGANRTREDAESIQLIRPRSNVTLIERPLRKETLLSTIHAALRARRRQYEVRDLLAERDELLASLEQRVVERTAKLQELNAELEAFSYSVSHDLRAPLRSMESYARILCDDYAGALPFEAKHYLQRIAKNAEKMDRLMQDVLTFSRIARGDIHLETVDLDVVLSETIDQYPDLATAHQQISIRTPLGCVLGHVPSLTQCFSNLLQNALKFVPPDRAAHIEVFTEQRGAQVRTNIRDNGIGIDPAHHGRIFGLFERAGPGTIPGTGIGLAIVKKAVERMGGTVGVCSSVGAGACFWVELPMAATQIELVSQPTALAG